MTSYGNGFEAGASGSALTPENSGGASGDPFDQVIVSGGSLVFDGARAAHGSRSLRATPGNNSINSFTYVKTGSGRVAIRGYFYFTQAVGTGMTLLWLGIGGTRVVNIELRPPGGSNRIRINDASGGSSNVFTSVVAMPFGQFVRMELDVTVGTTTSNGRVRFAMYDGDSTTPLDSYDSSARNTGTLPITTARWGAYSPTTDQAPFWIDSVGFNDAATGFIGPYVAANTAPTANAGPDQASVEPYSTVTLAGSGTDAEGAVTYSWAQVAGPTVTLAGSGASRTFEAPATYAGADLTFRLTVTDAGGLTATDDVIVSVLPHNEWVARGGVLVPARFNLA